MASLSVAFKNLAGLNGSKVEEVVIQNSHFSSLYGTLLHQSNARVLKIKNTPITMINEYTFWGINSTLEELRIINSSLTAFPKEAFKVLGNLKILELNYHEIQILNNNEFDDSQLPIKLEKFIVTNGKIEELGASMFQHLKKAKVVDLHGNQIVALKKNQFRGLRDAEVLDVSYNNIAKLESTHIADLTKLTFCNTSHNKLTELSRCDLSRSEVLMQILIVQLSILEAHSQETPF